MLDETKIALGLKNEIEQLERKIAQLEGQMVELKKGLAEKNLPTDIKSMKVEIKSQTISKEDLEKKLLELTHGYEVKYGRKFEELEEIIRKGIG